VGGWDPGSPAPTGSPAKPTKWTRRNKWAVGITVAVALGAVAANNKKKREQREHGGHSEDERQAFATSFQETLRRNGGDPLVRVRAADTDGTTLVIETKDCSGVSDAFGDYRLREDTRNDYGFTKVSCEFDHRALWSKDL
jgi:hypothetical protein